MAITEDASTPVVAALTGAGTGPNKDKVTTASFSPPANSLLLALVAGGYSIQTTSVTVTLADSLLGTWTNPVFENTTTLPATGPGTCYIFYRYLSTAPGSMTVTATFSNNLGGMRWLGVRVLNGANSDQSTGAVASAMDQTVAITTTTGGSQVYGVFDDAGHNDVITAAANTTIISDTNGTFSSTTDQVTCAGFLATNATTTPGSTTLGVSGAGTPADTVLSMFEVLPVPVLMNPRPVMLRGQAVNRAGTY